MYIAPATVVAGARRRHRSDEHEHGDDEPHRGRPRLVAPARSLASRAAPRVATLRSGIEAVIQGYEHLHAPHVHVAACDIDKHDRHSVM